MEEITAKRQRIREDVTAEDLLKIPEVDQALDELIALQDQHRDALDVAIAELERGDWPDVKSINAKYQPRIDAKSRKVEDLVRKYAA